jgi:hypothetical protein
MGLLRGVSENVLGFHNETCGPTCDKPFKIICYGPDEHDNTGSYSYRVNIYSTEHQNEYVVEFHRQSGNVISFLSNFYNPCVKGLMDAGYTAHRYSNGSVILASDL